MYGSQWTSRRSSASDIYQVHSVHIRYFFCSAIVMTCKDKKLNTLCLWAGNWGKSNLTHHKDVQIRLIKLLCSTHASHDRANIVAISCLGHSNMSDFVLSRQTATKDCPSSTNFVCLKPKGVKGEPVIFHFSDQRWQLKREGQHYGARHIRAYGKQCIGY